MFFLVLTIMGAIILSFYVMSSRAEVRMLKKERTKLLHELDGLRNMSIDEIPEVDTRINSGNLSNTDQE